MESNVIENEVALPAGAPAPEALERVAVYVEKSVAAIVIASPAAYEVAAGELKELQGKLDKITEQRFALTRPLDASKKAILDLFRSPSERIEAAIAALKAGMLTFQRNERARQAEEQRVRDEEARQERIRQQQAAIAAQAEADKKARELAETRRKQVEAEQEAIRAAAAGDKEAEEKAAAAAMAQQQEQARIESEIQRANEESSIQNQLALVMSAPVVESNTPKVKGISTAAPWTARLADDSDDTKLKLLAFVLANPQYISFIDINMKPIVQQAKSLQDKLQIPGVVAFQQESIRSRR